MEVILQDIKGIRVNRHKNVSILVLMEVILQVSEREDIKLWMKEFQSLF